jgi:hypothetical protein
MAFYRPEGLVQSLLDRMQYWPNAIGRSAGRKLDRRYKRRSERDFATAVAGLKPGDVCLDLGANRGDFTKAMAARGATVHAYEPDPDTFARLQAAVGQLPNVKLHQAAVGAREGTVTLRREVGYQDDPRAGRSDHRSAMPTGGWSRARGSTCRNAPLPMWWPPPGRACG